MPGVPCPSLSVVPPVVPMWYLPSPLRTSTWRWHLLTAAAFAQRVACVVRAFRVVVGVVIGGNQPLPTKDLAEPPTDDSCLVWSCPPLTCLVWSGLVLSPTNESYLGLAVPSTEGSHLRRQCERGDRLREKSGELFGPTLESL